MKAVILAAGKGVRLQPLTNDRPKSLVLVNGKPFLYYVIRNLEKAGFAHKDIGIIAGYRKEKIEEFAKKYGFGVKIIEQREQLGTANAVSCAEKFAGKEDFVVLMGDDLYDPRDIKKIASSDGVCYISGFRHAEPERFGVLVADGKRLVRIIEKPKKRITDMINAGLYKFTPEVFGALKRIKKSARGEYELTDAVTQLAKKGAVVVIDIENWLDIGNIGDVERMENFLKDNWSE